MAGLAGPPGGGRHWPDNCGDIATECLSLGRLKQFEVGRMAIVAGNEFARSLDGEPDRIVRMGRGHSRGVGDPRCDEHQIRSIYLDS